MSSLLDAQGAPLLDADLPQLAAFEAQALAPLAGAAPTAFRLLFVFKVSALQGRAFAIQIAAHAKPSEIADHLRRFAADLDALQAGTLLPPDHPANDATEAQAPLAVRPS